MPLTPTYLYGLTATAYITTCLVVATVRWFHMCRPYNRDPEYYYPGRPFVTLAWLSSLFLLPYMFHPESPDAWFLMKLYFLPVTLYNFTLMLFSYFGSVMQWKQWRWPTLIAGIPVILTLIAAVVLAIIPGDQIGGTTIEYFVLHALSILSTCICLFSVGVIFIWAKRLTSSEDYSNPTDFPVEQASRWLKIIVFNILLCWAGILIDNQTVLALMLLILSFASVFFLLTALHPNRNRPMVEEPAVIEEPEETQVYHRSLTKKKQDEIIKAIRTVVETQRGYLEPHLTLQDVADRCGYNRTYISGIIKNEMGGFFTYVNTLRLKHVEQYLRENPEAPIAEAIDASGFGSRPTYYKIRHQLEMEEQQQQQS